MQFRMTDRVRIRKFSSSSAASILFILLVALMESMERWIINVATIWIHCILTSSFYIFLAFSSSSAASILFILLVALMEPMERWRINVATIWIHCIFTCFLLHFRHLSISVNFWFLVNLNHFWIFMFSIKQACKGLC